MLTVHTFALALAAICFLIAARPPAGVGVHFGYLGAAFVVLAWLF